MPTSHSKSAALRRQLVRSAPIATKAVLGNIGPGLLGTEAHDFGVLAATSVRPVFEVPIHRVTAAGDLMIDVSSSGFPLGRLGTIEFIVRMGPVGGHSVGFRGCDALAPCGAPPRLATAVNTINRLTFASDDDGRSVMGRLVFRSHRQARA